MIIPNEFYIARDIILKAYGHDKISSILVYGSRITNASEVDAYSDYDVTIVLNNNIENIQISFPFDIDLTITSKNKIEKNIERFTFYNHGAFYVYSLAEAIPVYGENCFRDFLDCVPENEIKRSLTEQIYNHCYKLELILIQKNNLKSRNRNVKKYCYRLLQNMYFLMLGINYKIFQNRGYNEWLKIYKESGLFTEKILLNMGRLLESNNFCADQCASIIIADIKKMVTDIKSIDCVL